MSEAHWVQTLEWNPGSQGILVHLCRAGLHSKVAPLPVMHEASYKPTSHQHQPLLGFLTGLVKLISTMLFILILICSS